MQSVWVHYEDKLYSITILLLKAIENILKLNRKHWHCNCTNENKELREENILKLKKNSITNGSMVKLASVPLGIGKLELGKWTLSFTSFQYSSHVSSLVVDIPNTSEVPNDSNFNVRRH